MRSARSSWVSPSILTLLLLWIAVPISHADTYYVSTSGADDNSCPKAQSPDGKAKRTINGGIACLRGGDTLIVQDGTYDEVITDSNGLGGYSAAVPSGSSFDKATTIKAEHSRQTTLRLSTPPIRGWNTVIAFFGSTHHVILQGFVIDGKPGRPFTTRCGHFEGQDVHHIRVQDVECSWPQNQGFFTGGVHQNHEFLNVDIHDNGKDPDSGAEVCTGNGQGVFAGFCHGYYLSEHNVGDILIDGGTIRNIDGYGVQAYSSNVTVRNVRFENILEAGIITLSGGVTAYNNVIINSGICVYVIGNNNTIVYNTAWGTGKPSTAFCFYNRNDGRNNVIKNNLVLNRPVSESKGYFFVEGGSGASKNKLVDDATLGGQYGGNLCDHSAMVGCTAASAPCFVVNASATGDFRLCPTSPALGAGEALSGFATDRDGVRRTRNSPGAHEGTGEGTGDGPPQLTLPAPQNLRALTQ